MAHQCAEKKKTKPNRWLSPPITFNQTTLNFREVYNTATPIRYIGVGFNLWASPDVSWVSAHYRAWRGFLPFSQILIGLQGRAGETWNTHHQSAWWSTVITQLVGVNYNQQALFTDGPVVECVRHWSESLCIIFWHAWDN